MGKQKKFDFIFLGDNSKIDYGLAQPKTKIIEDRFGPSLAEQETNIFKPGSPQIDTKEDPLSADFHLRTDLSPAQKDSAYQGIKGIAPEIPNTGTDFKSVFFSKPDQPIKSFKDTFTKSESTAPKESTSAFQKERVEEQFLVDDYGVKKKDLLKGNSKKAESVLGGIQAQANIEQKRLSELSDLISSGGATDETIKEFNKVQGNLKRLTQQGEIAGRFLEKSYKEESGLGDLFEEFWKTLKYQPQQAIGGTLSMVNQVLANTQWKGGQLLPAYNYDEQTSKLKETADWLLEQGTLKEKELKPKLGFWAEFGRGAASMAMMAPMAIAGTVASGNPAVGFVAGFVPSFVLEGGLAYKEAKDYGLSDKDATMYSLPIGLINGAIEQITELGIGKEIARRIGKEVTNELAKKGLLQEFVQAFAKGAKSEGLEEYFQEVTNLTAESIYKNVGDKPGVKEWMERPLNSALYGSLLGGLMAGGSIAGQKVAEKFGIEVPKAEEPKELTPKDIIEIQNKAIQKEEPIVEKPKTIIPDAEKQTSDLPSLEELRGKEESKSPFEKFTGQNINEAKEKDLQEVYDQMQEMVENEKDFDADDVKLAKDILAEIEVFKPKEEAKAEGEFFDKESAPANIKENFKPASRDFPNIEEKRSQVPKKLFKTLEDGTKVYLVDGTFIRDNVDIDFTMGGHDFVYPQYIPKNEIWLDQDINETELENTLRHENTERQKMIEGEKYNKAHEVANKEEISIRTGKESPVKKDNELQIDIMKKAGIPEEEMADYALSSVADGKILRNYIDEIKNGEIDVEEAVSRVKRDYDKMKAGEKEGKFIEPEEDPKAVALKSEIAELEKKIKKNPDNWRALNPLIEGKKKELNELENPKEKNIAEPEENPEKIAFDDAFTNYSPERLAGMSVDDIYNAIPEADEKIAEKIKNEAQKRVEAKRPKLTAEQLKSEIADLKKKREMFGKGDEGLGLADNTAQYDEIISAREKELAELEKPSEKQPYEMTREAKEAEIKEEAPAKTEENDKVKKQFATYNSNTQKYDELVPLYKKDTNANNPKSLEEYYADNGILMVRGRGKYFLSPLSSGEKAFSVKQGEIATPLIEVTQREKLFTDFYGNIEGIKAQIKRGQELQNQSKGEDVQPDNNKESAFRMFKEGKKNSEILTALNIPRSEAGKVIEWRKEFEKENIDEKIKNLEVEIKNKKDNAQYLMGNKKGAWGQPTEADKKRAREIEILQDRLDKLKNVKKETSLISEPENKPVKELPAKKKEPRFREPKSWQEAVVKYIVQGGQIKAKDITPNELRTNFGLSNRNINRTKGMTFDTMISDLGFTSKEQFNDPDFDESKLVRDLLAQYNSHEKRVKFLEDLNRAEPEMTPEARREAGDLQNLDEIILNEYLDPDGNLRLAEIENNKKDILERAGTNETTLKEYLAQKEREKELLNFEFGEDIFGDLNKAINKGVINEDGVIRTIKDPEGQKNSGIGVKEIESQAEDIESKEVVKERISEEEIESAIKQADEVIKPLFEETPQTPTPISREELYQELAGEIQRVNNRSREAIKEGKRSKATINFDRLAEKYNTPKKQIDHIAGLVTLNSLDNPSLQTIIKRVKENFESLYPSKSEVLAPEQQGESGDVIENLRKSINIDDIPKDLARRAFYNTSHSPDERGDSYREGIVSDLNNILDNFVKIARSDKQKQILAEEFPRFKDNYISKEKGLLSSHSNLASSFITGPANFPKRQMEKRNRAYDNKEQEFREWRGKAINSIDKKLQGQAVEDAGGEFEITKQKLEKAEKLQQIMKDANAIIRKKNLSTEQKIEQLQKAGLSESNAKELLKPSAFGGLGFEQFSLTNNNALIKRLKEKLATMEKRDVMLDKNIETIGEFEGGKIINNFPEERVQIEFDNIPSEEIRSQLKSNGWRWSPKNKVWQRQNTQYAINDANRLLDKFGRKPDDQILKQDLFERNELQKLQDRKRHLELVIEEAEKKGNKEAITKAKDELKDIKNKLAARRTKENQFDMFGDAQDQISLFQKEHTKIHNAFIKLSPREQDKFLTQLNRMLASNWGVEFKNLSKEQAAGITHLLRKVIELDPNTANFTTLWEEAFHQSMIALAKPFAAKNMLRKAGWDGKGEIWDVKGNKSLRDAHENLAKDFISWVESSKEPQTNIERVFAKLKELWNKIAAFLYQMGFQTHAGYFEMLYSGKLKASAEGINVEDLAQSLAQEINRDENFKRWFKGSKVTNPDGTAKIVYHGTGQSFDVWKDERQNGIFFTEDNEIAGAYANTRYPYEASQVYPAFLKLENPFYANEKNLSEYFKKEYGVIGEELEEYLEDYAYSNGWHRDRINLYAKRNGYDGVIIEKDYAISNKKPFDKSYVVFSPSQIKSIFNRGTFDPNDPNILNSAFSPIWFSKLERVIEAKAPGKNINPQSLVAMLKNNGVKDEEIKWLDVEGFLRDNPKATKQELLDYVRSNQVEIKELTNKDGDYEDVGIVWDSERESSEKFDALPEADQELIGESVEELNELVDEEGEELIKKGKLYNIESTLDRRGYTANYDEDGYVKNITRRIKVQPTKFSNWKTPGGTNYREVLLTLPERQTEGLLSKPEPVHITYIERVRGNIYNSRDNITSYKVQFSDGTNSEVGAGILGQEASDEAVKDYFKNIIAEKQDRADRRYREYYNKETGKSNFKSSHWGEPNVLVHFRLQDFTDSKGRRVLLVEEVQSDWHEKGRKEGYKEKPLTELPEGYFIEKVPAKYPGKTDLPFDAKEERVGGNIIITSGRTIIGEGWDLQSAKENAIRNISQDTYYVKNPDGKRIGYRSDTPEQATKIALEELNKKEYSKVPNAPFKSTWHELALKRILRLAAQEGYDGVSLTTGEMQSDRYDLGKQIDKLKYRKLAEGRYEIVAVKNGEEVIRKQGLNSTQLEDHVGKDLTKKIVEQASDKEQSFSGTDLKIGSAGMTAFYDRMLPNFLNSYGKKWGAKVEETNIDIKKKDEADYDISENDDGEFDVFDNRGNLVGTFETMIEADDFIGGWIYNKKDSFPYFPITDPMRRSVLFEGQALFQKLPERQEESKPEQRSDLFAERERIGNTIWDEGARTYEEFATGVIEKGLDMRPIDVFKFYKETRLKNINKPEKPIGLNKEEIKSFREELDLEQFEPPKRRSILTALSDAKERKLNISALELADEVIRRKQPISDAEHAGMVMRAKDLRDEFNSLTEDIATLTDKGDILTARKLQIRREVILTQLDKLTLASDYAGTELARALNIRKMRVKGMNYDLASILQRAKANKGGRLSEKEIKEFEELAERYKQTEQELTRLRNDYDKVVAEKEKLLAQKLTEREARKHKVADKATVARDKILKERVEIKKQLAALGMRLNDVTGLTTEGSYLVGRLAINYIKEGAVNLNEVVQRVLADLPDITERDVYRALNQKDPNRQESLKKDIYKRIQQIKKQAELLEEIKLAENGIFKEPTKRPPTAREIIDLRKVLTSLRNEAYKGELEAKKLERGLQTINELQDQLANQYRLIKKQRPADSEELQIIKDKIKELRRTMNLDDRLADLREQLRTREFKIKEKEEPEPLPPEIERKIVELNALRKKIRLAIQETEPITPKKVGIEIINMFRTAKASMDMSATLRQGFWVSVRRPNLFYKTFKKSFKSFFDQYTYDQIQSNIEAHPNHYIAVKSGLELTDMDATPSEREEMFLSNWAEKIPIYKIGVKASNRHMVTTLNLLREGTFYEFLEKYPNATSEELKAWADYVNIATGRGDLGRFSQAANVLSLGIFSPRFAVSRFQTPFMMFKYWNEPRVRKEIAKDYVAVASLGATALILAALAGFKVDLDPDDPDFAKIQVGNTRIDMFAGVQQPMRVILRTGKALAEKTGVLQGRGRLDNPLEMVGRFSSYKLAPSITIPNELLTGRTLVGGKVTPFETLANATVPMVYMDIADAYKDGGFERAVWTGMLNFFGTSTNTYKGR